MSWEWCTTSDGNGGGLQSGLGSCWRLAPTAAALMATHTDIGRQARYWLAPDGICVPEILRFDSFTLANPRAGVVGG